MIPGDETGKTCSNLRKTTPREPLFTVNSLQVLLRHRLSWN